MTLKLLNSFSLLSKKVTSFSFSKSFSLVVISIFSAAVFGSKADAIDLGDGGMTSGGGIGVLCEDSNKKVTAEFFDLWEQQQFMRSEAVKLLPKYRSLKDAALVIARRLEAADSNDSMFKSILETNFLATKNLASRSSILEHFQFLINAAIEAEKYTENIDSSPLLFLEKGAGLTSVGDSKHVIRPNGNCKEVQLANYQVHSIFTMKQNSRKLLINRSVYDRLSALHKAAFFLHEATYLYLRRFGKDNSVYVRSFVSKIVLSNGQVLSPLNPDAISKTNLFCMSMHVWERVRNLQKMNSSFRYDPFEFRRMMSRRSNVFWVTAEKKIYFEIINGTPMLSRAVADLNVNLADGTNVENPNNIERIPFQDWFMNQSSSIEVGKVFPHALTQVDEIFLVKDKKQALGGFPHRLESMILTETQDKRRGLLRFLSFENQLGQDEIHCTEVSSTRNQNLFKGNFVDIKE